MEYEPHPGPTLFTHVQTSTNTHNMHTHITMPKKKKKKSPDRFVSPLILSGSLNVNVKLSGFCGVLGSRLCGGIRGGRTGERAQLVEGYCAGVRTEFKPRHPRKQPGI